MKPGYKSMVLLNALVFLFPVNSLAVEIQIADSRALSRALGDLEPGTVLSLAPNVFQGSLYIRGAAGTAEQPITIQGVDPNDPPVFMSGNQAMHLADCSFITLRNLKVIGFPLNGINIDDGGSFDTPAHHIVLENVTILETGPTGNHDALKLSGVDRFQVRNCRFEGWGGSGIDMVGCHDGVIEGCHFVGRSGFSQSNGVQLKGGTENVKVQYCHFKDAGHRSVNLGGSTGLQFFRPEVGDFEARNITIASNRFEGSMAPIAWVTADVGHVHHNTIILPDKWILRILQESQDSRFKPCHDGLFEHNTIIYDSQVRVFVNVGPGTAPETFTFRHNVWIDLDRNRQPTLPVPEEGGLYF